VAGELLARLDIEHPVLARPPAGERLIAAVSSTSRRLSALSNFYRHLVEHPGGHRTIQ